MHASYIIILSLLILINLLYYLHDNLRISNIVRNGLMKLKASGYIKPKRQNLRRSKQSNNEDCGSKSEECGSESGQCGTEYEECESDSN